MGWSRVGSWMVDSCGQLDLKVRGRRGWHPRLHGHLLVLLLLISISMGRGYTSRTWMEEESRTQPHPSPSSPSLLLRWP